VPVMQTDPESMPDSISGSEICGSSLMRAWIPDLRFAPSGMTGWGPETWFGIVFSVFKALRSYNI